MVESSLIPPINGIEEKITDPLNQAIVEAANNASAVQLWYDQYLPSEVAEVHKSTSQEIFGNLITPEEANKEMQQAMQDYLAKAE